MSVRHKLEDLIADEHWFFGLFVFMGMLGMIVMLYVHVFNT